MRRGRRHLRATCEPPQRPNQGCCSNWTATLALPADRRVRDGEGHAWGLGSGSPQPQTGCSLGDGRRLRLRAVLPPLWEARRPCLSLRSLGLRGQLLLLRRLLLHVLTAGRAEAERRGGRLALSLHHERDVAVVCNHRGHQALIGEARQGASGIRHRLVTDPRPCRLWQLGHQPSKRPSPRLQRRLLATCE